MKSIVGAKTKCTSLKAESPKLYAMAITDARRSRFQRNAIDTLNMNQTVFTMRLPLSSPIVKDEMKAKMRSVISPEHSRRTWNPTTLPSSRRTYIIKRSLRYFTFMPTDSSIRIDARALISQAYPDARNAARMKERVNCTIAWETLGFSFILRVLAIHIHLAFILKLFSV